jgi:hypothetical protein
VGFPLEKYRGGNGVWHDTHYNRDFVANGSAGKEWMLDNMVPINSEHYCYRSKITATHIFGETKEIEPWISYSFM